MINLVMFDLGGVVVNFSESMYVEYISKKFGIPLNKAMAIKRDLPKLEVGGMTVMEYKKRVIHILQLSPGTNIEWNAAFIKLASTNKKVEALARSLHKRYKTALITNISASRYYSALKYKFDKSVFDRRFTSYGMRIRKPNPEIYNRVLSSMKAKAEESVFIDNRLENVRGAESVGIYGIVFKSYGQLVGDLAKLGVS